MGYTDIHINPRATCDRVRAKMGLGPITAPHRYIETDVLEKAFRWFDDHVKVDAGRDVFGSLIWLKFPTTRIVKDCAPTADYCIEAVLEEADVVRTLGGKLV